MRFPRMTTRRWMAAVLMMAIGMAVVVWVERWPHISTHREIRAMVHALEESAATHGGPFEDDAGRVWLPSSHHVKWPPNPRLAAYHATMRRKWERAARHPWLRVEPDPPEPE